MSGVTKHIFEHDMRDIKDMLKKQLISIQNILPFNYTEEDIVYELKRFYPYEWKSVEIKYYYYQKKDWYIKNRFGKARYNMQRPEIILKSISTYKKIMSNGYKKAYNDNFSEINVAKEESFLWNRRKAKIEKINQKIEKALSKTQQVTPSFLDKLIGLYERKNTKQKDKVYILLELKKYYSPEIIQFFFKINDTELNKQLRMEAFYHLQSFNYNPRLRSQKYIQVHTKNKKRKEYLKKKYPDEEYTIPTNPNELEYRIENANEQKIKEFDFFISHSSVDSDVVQKLINYENEHEKNIFCDWINDVDYLKRHLVCEATLKVLEKRLEQSNELIFVKSENSLKSVWCKYELNYFYQLGKTIYIVNKEDIEKNNYDIKLLKEEWFLDSNYKKIALFEGAKIKE